MKLKDVLQILSSYNSVDIETKDKLIRRNIYPNELSEELLRSYISIYSIITIIPKRLVGQAPMKAPDEAITLTHKDLEGVGMGSIEPLGIAGRSVTAESELYKIMYENAKEEAREYKRKYEDALNDKHKAEIELASKGGGLGEIAQGLGSLAPMFLGMGAQPQAPALGEAQVQPQAHAQVAKKADVRLQAIVKHYATLSDTEKNSVYNLLSKVFADMSKIDELTSLLD